LWRLQHLSLLLMILRHQVISTFGQNCMPLSSLFALLLTTGSRLPNCFFQAGPGFKPNYIRPPPGYLNSNLPPGTTLTFLAISAGEKNGERQFAFYFLDMFPNPGDLLSLYSLSLGFASDYSRFFPLVQPKRICPVRPLPPFRHSLQGFVTFPFRLPFFGDDQLNELFDPPEGTH